MEEDNNNRMQMLNLSITHELPLKFIKQKKLWNLSIVQLIIGIMYLVVFSMFDFFG